MDERLVNELEAAIADAGALLVRMQKYRWAARPAVAELRRATLALGDAARRLHRHDALDTVAARRLLGEAARLVDGLRTELAAAAGSPEYRRAAAALAAGDAETLAALLPAVFADLEGVTDPPDLFHALAWLRRGRLVAPADVAAAVRALRDAGLEAEGDDLSPGADAGLPAVVLAVEPPPDEPVVLRVPAAALPRPIHRLVETGDHLLHARRVRLPGVVRLARALGGDEQLRVEVSPEEYTRWRTEVAAALAAAGLPVEDE